MAARRTPAQLVGTTVPYAVYDIVASTLVLLVTGVGRRSTAGSHDLTPVKLKS